MRVHYMSDLHLEFGDLRNPLPEGDVLILASDITLTKCLGPKRTDASNRKLRDRTNRLFDEARENFDHVLYLTGNHEPYNFDLFESHAAVCEHIQGDGVTYLCDSGKEIDGVMFAGGTLWTDMDNENPQTMLEVGFGLNDFRIVSNGDHTFSTADAVKMFKQTRDFIAGVAKLHDGKPMVIVTHHAPSRLGLHPHHCGNGLDGGFASNLHDLIEYHPNIKHWVFGHTHIRTSFNIGNTICRANCRGYDTRSYGGNCEANGFESDTYFEI